MLTIFLIKEFRRPLLPEAGNTNCQVFLARTEYSLMVSLTKTRSICGNRIETLSKSSAPGTKEVGCREQISICGKWE